MTPRDQLIELIEAYAAAQVSENQKLKMMMTLELKEWLEKHDIVAPVAAPDEVIEAVGKAKK